MTNEQITAIAVCSVIALPLIIISIVLMTGRGGDFVAGFNTKSRAEREKYDEKAVCRCVGRFTLPAGLLMPLLPLGGVYAAAFIGYTVIGAAVVMISLRKSEKFRR